MSNLIFQDRYEKLLKFVQTERLEKYEIKTHCSCTGVKSPAEEIKIYKNGDEKYQYIIQVTYGCGGINYYKTKKEFEEIMRMISTFKIEII